MDNYNYDYAKYHKSDNLSDFRNYVGKYNHKFDYMEETLYEYNNSFGRMDFKTVATLFIETDKGIKIKTSSSSIFGINELRNAYLQHIEKTKNGDSFY